MRSFGLLLVWHQWCYRFSSVARIYDICLQFISIDVDRRPENALVCDQIGSKSRSLC